MKKNIGFKDFVDGLWSLVIILALIGVGAAVFNKYWPSSEAYSFRKATDSTYNLIVTIAAIGYRRYAKSLESDSSH